MSVDLTIHKYDPNEFINTSNGQHKISKTAQIHGSQQISFVRKCILMNNAIIRGDLSTITMGNHSFIGEKTIVRPCSKIITSGVTYFPLRIGSHVIINENCIVTAAEIGDFVFVGKNSIIGQSSVIKNCCYIMEDSLLAPDTIAPPFSILGGNPAQIIGKMPVNTSQMMTDLTNELYYKFIPDV